MTEPYRVTIGALAWREIMDLPQAAQERVFKAIEGLEPNPRPSGVKKLKSRRDVYRVRTGNYRIIYEVHDAVLLVLVVAVGDRRDVYRAF